VPPIWTLFDRLASIPLPLAIASVPVTSVPMRFPWITALSHCASVIALPVLPEMRLPSPAPLPPMIRPAPCEQLIPAAFGIATVPVASTPM